MFQNSKNDKNHVSNQHRVSDVLTDNYFTMIFSLKKTKIESLTRQQITATIIALFRAWPDHAGWNLFSISVPPPIPNVEQSRHFR